ncbi:peptidoglycan-binding protein [Shimazuella alba]|uniref:Peptidoglycan binding domain-containing protein n=1 Tax=Shimazuella alba TaxID=2690964 RepID=A0A6I4VWQ4_9BACL|nr:peptidoglycan-binding protein [Shimazuella alba]MXQ54276.1 hypothetical protein [Shimazuella alba]
MSKLTNFFKEKLPSNKLIRWLELTSIGVICTFGGFFVYQYTQTFAESTPFKQNQSKEPRVVVSTVVSNDANKQIMENLPSKSVEITLKVKPIPYQNTDQTAQQPNTGNSSSLIGSSDTVEKPDATSTTPESTTPANPTEVTGNSDQIAVAEAIENLEVNGQNQEQNVNNQKPKPASKTKPTPITVTTKPTIPVTKPTKPVTKPSKPVTKPTKPVTKPTKPVTKPTTPKPTKPVTKPVTKPTTPKPTKPVTKPTTPKPKPSKPKAPYPVTKSFPGTKYFKSGAKNKYVTQLGYMLVTAGYGKYYKVGPSPEWSSADLKNCQAFQRAQGWTGSDADGYPGPETWKRLVNIYYKKYSS